MNVIYMHHVIKTVQTQMEDLPAPVMRAIHWLSTKSTVNVCILIV